jgi:tRNA(fMet)-specific endonuclease VapC
MDLKIAAIAISQGALLLSRNLGDFRRVTDLNVQDWS